MAFISVIVQFCLLFEWLIQLDICGIPCTFLLLLLCDTIRLHTSFELDDLNEVNCPQYASHEERWLKDWRVMLRSITFAGVDQKAMQAMLQLPSMCR